MVNPGQLRGSLLARPVGKKRQKKEQHIRTNAEFISRIAAGGLHSLRFRLLQRSTARFAHQRHGVGMVMPETWTLSGRAQVPATDNGKRMV